jgi:hypothetical protein
MYRTLVDKLHWTVHSVEWHNGLCSINELVTKTLSFDLYLQSEVFLCLVAFSVVPCGPPKNWCDKA